MQRELIRWLVVALTGLALWQFSTFILDMSEPWDSPYYMGFYLGALGLSGLFGYLFTEHAWRWGVIIVFAQLPVMLINAEVDGLLLAGLLFLSALSLPAIIAARAASHLHKLRHTAD